jgi:hypothetical protein
VALLQQLEKNMEANATHKKSVQLNKLHGFAIYD